MISNLFLTTYTSSFNTNCIKPFNGDTSALAPSKKNRKRENNLVYDPSPSRSSSTAPIYALRF